MTEVDRLSDVWQRATGVRPRTVYIATDDRSIITATSAYSRNYTFLHFAEALAFAKQVNPHAIKWDKVVHSQAKGSSTSMNMRVATDTTVELSLLSLCHLFVGKHTSQLFRMAYELHAARCACAAPAISLDAPWCFDKGVFAGSSAVFKGGVGERGVKGSSTLKTFKC
jgi:hypothetical protein